MNIYEVEDDLKNVATALESFAALRRQRRALVLRRKLGVPASKTSDASGLSRAMVCRIFDARSNDG